MIEEPQTAPLERDESAAPGMTSRQRWLILGAVAVGLVLLGLIVATVAWLSSNPAQTETFRDIVIIFMAVESLLIGLVLIILVVQLSRLTALIQNEVKPILDSTNETIRTVRGTTTFLSENLVSPVIRINSSVAGIRRALKMLRPDR